MNDKELKEQILKSVDDNLVKDNKQRIIYAFNEQKAPKKAKKKFNWGLFTGGVAAIACAAIIIPSAINANKGNGASNDTNTDVTTTQPSTGEDIPSLENIPEKVNEQASDISFGVASLSNVLSNSIADKNVKLAQPLFAHHGGEHGEPPEEEQTDYVTYVDIMYSLAEPYLPTIDSILNGEEFVYQIELSGDETYPYKLGNFIFNIIEDTSYEEEPEEPTKDDDEGESDGEDQDEQPDMLEDGEGETTSNPQEGEGEGEPEEPSEPEDDPEQPNSEFILEFYNIEGLLIIEENQYVVTGEQVTYQYTYNDDIATYSELYLNVALDETHEITVFKTTSSESFSNTFRDVDVSMNYECESYKYIESEITTETDKQGRERKHRDITDAIELSIESYKQTIGEYQFECENAYLSLESSYVEEEVTNTIEADLCFRLPSEHDLKGNPYFLEDEGETTSNPDEGEGEPEEDEEQLTKAFRVDYELKVTKDQQMDQVTEYGHGQHGHGHDCPGGRGGHNQSGKESVVVYGSFYVNKDAEGNLVKPDFATEGRHTVDNHGYHNGWFDDWDW